MAEKWDAYDRFRNKLGFEIVRGEQIPDGTMHLVVHMIYYNTKGQILVQKRSAGKELAPGVWAFTGGSALAGEDTRAACIRETEEEMGFTPDMSNAQLILSYSRKDSFSDVYLIKADIEASDLRLQKEEVDDVRWVNRSEFEQMIAEKGAFWEYSYLPTVVKYMTEAGYLY